jgi:succinyl-CoA synthetase beta subunit
LRRVGPQAQKVRRLLIEEGADIAKELYVGMVADRGTQRVVLMASSEGGMDIEEVAAKTPQKIHKVFIDPAAGLAESDARDVARKIGVPEASLGQAAELLRNLYRCYWETDASLVEVNPLVVTGDGRVVALDAKLTFDDNAGCGSMSMRWSRPIGGLTSLTGKIIGGRKTRPGRRASWLWMRRLALKGRRMR